jgi:hypothetical protein
MMRVTGGVLAALLLLAGLVWVAADQPRVAAVAEVIENVRVPLMRHQNGRVKAMLHARAARMQTAEQVTAEGVRVTLYDELEVPEGVMTAERAAIDQRRGKGRGEGAVRFQHRGVLIKGTGLTWDANISLLVIETNVVVELERGGKTLAEGWK